MPGSETGFQKAGETYALKECHAFCERIVITKAAFYLVSKSGKQLGFKVQYIHFSAFK